MIAFVHLLNDCSGSPRVLASAIAALCPGGCGGQLFVGSDGAGCLDDVGIPITRYWYRRGNQRLVTLFTFVFSQVSLFLKLMRARELPRDGVLYVNTLLPFGAALFGALTRRRVVYHLHEVSVGPAPLDWFLTWIARLTADRLIYVSESHRLLLPILSVPALTVPNALDESFRLRASASAYRHRRGGVFDVLMLTSLRDYKGVPELLAVAAHLRSRTDIRFHLVANDDDADVQRYFQGKRLPLNVTVHPRTADPGSHYSRASVVLNLSRPDLCTETFGLTLLEAMAFGVPVIAPPVGGPAELVCDGQEGFLIDCRNIDALAERLRLLADDEALCMRLSAAARSRASGFSHAAFAQALRSALDFNSHASK